MPIISVEPHLLFAAMEREFTEEQFEELCFDFGIELDEVVEEEGKEMWKIDLPANRYDLLCLEGLSTALKVFLGTKEKPNFVVQTPSAEVASATKLTVAPDTQKIRPFVVAAVLRNVTFTEDNYQSFIALQDHLHRNICRRRTLVAIGTHDLDTLQGPFTYEALPPEQIKFRHLNHDKEMQGKEMLDWFRTEEAGKHIREYTNIIYDSPVYPVIYDANRVVLSLPPIINGDHSKITLNTRNVFIECTATDRTKAEIVLNTMIAMFSQYCDAPYTVESVQVEYAEEPHKSYGLKHEFPNMSERSFDANLDEMCSIIGVPLEPTAATQLLTKMMLGPATFDEASRAITVSVPVTRSDILHAVDIIEDAAIAFGYNNVPKRFPVSHTAGKELPINLLSDLVRVDLANAGYTEILSLGLLSKADLYDDLRCPEDDKAVTVGNPKNTSFEMVRTRLIPGMLKTMSANASMKIANGIKLFEVSDVVYRDPSCDVGARNERHIAAMYTGPTAGFEIIHGLVDRIMQILSVVPSADYCPEAAHSPLNVQMVELNQAIGEYKVQEGAADMYLPKRCADVLVKLNGESEFTNIGNFGMLHPEVLVKFKHTYPASVVEINLQKFL